MRSHRFGIMVMMFSVSMLLAGCERFVYGVDIVNYGQNGVIILQLGQQQGVVRKPYTVRMADGRNRLVTNVTSPGLEGMPFVIAMVPRIPATKYRDPANAFGRFAGYPNALPDELEVVWQLAELRDCSSEHWVTPLEESPRYLGAIENAKLLVDEEFQKKVIETARRETTWVRLEEAGYDPSQHVNKGGCTWTPMPDKVYRQTIDLRVVRDGEAYKRTGRPYREVALSRFTLNLTLVFIEDQLTVKAESRVTNPWQ